MADDITLDPGTGGKVVRALEDASAIQWPVGVVAYATTIGDPDVLTIPVAAALADTTANPTTLLSGACCLVYNGATWDMMRGTVADGLLVNLGGNNDVTVTSGTLAATQSGVWNVTNVSGTISLPTGAATEATLLAQSLVDNAGFTDGTSRVLPAGYIFDAVAGTALTENDVAAARIDSKRAQVFVIEDETTRGRRATVTAGLALKIDGSGATQPVSNGGTFAVQLTGGGLTALQLIDNTIVAHDAPVSGSTGVAMTGFVARSTSPTAVGDADATQGMATLLGKQVVMPYAIPASTWRYAAASGGIVNTTGVAAKAAEAGAIRNYVTRAQVINGHATVSTDVQIRDGASGTVIWRGFAQASGGGVTCVFDPPLRGSAATLIEIACGTTGSATYVNLQGFIAAE